MKKTCPILFIAILGSLLFCSSPNDNVSEERDNVPVAVQVLGKVQAGSYYEVTVTANDMAQIGPNRYDAGTTIRLSVPPGNGRQFLFRKFSIDAVLTDTALKIVDIGPGKNTIVVELVSVAGPITYTITYDGNGNTGGSVPTPQMKTQDVELTLSGNTGSLVKSGYTFVGWNDAADASGSDYAVGASFSADANETLYAKWTSLPTYTVTYNGNGNTGGSVPAPQTKTQDVALTLSVNTGSLVKTGFSFSGWNTAVNGSGTNYAVGASYTADANVTLHAKWTATGGGFATPVVLGSELVVGSNGNSTLGGSIDIDAGMVYLSAAAKTNSNKVDLCYAYSGTANTDKIGTPRWANASLYAFANGWTTYNPTKFYKLVAGITNTAAISATYATREVLEAAFDVSKAVESDNAVKGDVFIVKTDMDVIALLWVKDQVVGTTGTITVITSKYAVAESELGAIGAAPCTVSITTGSKSTASVAAYGDTGVTVTINGSVVALTSNQATPAVDIGANCVGLEVSQVYNQYGGALIGAVAWNCGSDSVKTGSTWKYSFTAPTGWNTAGFDDSKWHTAREINEAPGTARQARDAEVGNEPKYTLDQNAKWIWSGPNYYYRKEITTPAGSATIKVCGAQRYSFYVDGVVKVDNDSSYLIAKELTVGLTAGAHCFAAVATDTTKGDWGGNFIMEIVIGRQSYITDGTWKMNVAEVDGWKAVGFDDSDWYSANDLGDYVLRRGTEKTPKLTGGFGDPWLKNAVFGPKKVDGAVVPASTARWIGGQYTIYFRKEFTVQ